ncbi:hypothetical protein [Trueperella bialowiezensis]|uniref:hypothetical protein n=1 Tax=Trueperella bialowiezensis TaxID=312285 RepID=UPI000F8285C5|nr:hypothetical protein [Trueperella bialowiezensis]
MHHNNIYHLSGFETVSSYTIQIWLIPREHDGCPDVIGESNATTHGWLPETVDHWQANRPGREARTDLKNRS